MNIGSCRPSGGSTADGEFFWSDGMKFLGISVTLGA
jgi:hypothetical protein